MTAADRRALLAAHAASTPGPWTVDWNDNDGDGWVDRINDRDGVPIIETDSGVYGPGKNDADYIVAAVAAVPALCRALDEAEASERRCRQILEKWVEYRFCCSDTPVKEKLDKMLHEVEDATMDLLGYNTSTVSAARPSRP